MHLSLVCSYTRSNGVYQYRGVKYPQPIVNTIQEYSNNLISNAQTIGRIMVERLIVNNPTNAEEEYYNNSSCVLSIDNVGTITFCPNVPLENYGTYYSYPITTQVPTPMYKFKMISCTGKFVMTSDSFVTLSVFGDTRVIKIYHVSHPGSTPYTHPVYGHVPITNY
jgi:hypothetical protein